MLSDKIKSLLDVISDKLQILSNDLEIDPLQTDTNVVGGNETLLRNYFSTFHPLDSRNGEVEEYPNPITQLPQIICKRLGLLCEGHKKEFHFKCVFFTRWKEFLFQRKQTPLLKVIIYLSESQRMHSKTPLRRGTNGKSILFMFRRIPEYA